MVDGKSKILIIDEAGFSRVCSAILDAEGFRSETIVNGGIGEDGLNGNSFSMVITSYPYAVTLFDQIKGFKVPILVLTDHLSKELITMLEEFDKSYCMIKPLDYQKFKTLICQLISGKMSCAGGYSIV